MTNLYANRQGIKCVFRQTNFYDFEQNFFNIQTIFLRMNVPRLKGRGIQKANAQANKCNAKGRDIRPKR